MPEETASATAQTDEQSGARRSLATLASSGSEKIKSGADTVKQGVKTGFTKVMESEKVRKSIEVGKSVLESEKVQKGVAVVKEKANAVKENEKVQRGANFVKEKAGLAKEKASAGIGWAKSKGKVVWAGGKGTVVRVRNSIQEGEWTGSAANTLGVDAKEGLWKDIKVKGAEEIQIPARAEHTTSYHVDKGQLLRWTFRVKERDLGFAVRLRRMADGGSQEEEVLPLEKFDDQETISGSYFCDEKNTIVLVFDNTYSKLRSKTVAYIVGVETAPKDLPIVETNVAHEGEEEEAEFEDCETKGSLEGGSAARPEGGENMLTI